MSWKGNFTRTVDEHGYQDVLVQMMDREFGQALEVGWERDPHGGL